MKSNFVVLSLLIFCKFCYAQKIKIIKNDAAQMVDVIIDNKPFTSLIYPSEEILKKASLYPIRTANGTLITRGWPLDPRPGERIDHPHHVGLWLNYEDVNGFDYWNNSTAIKPEERLKRYGTIKNTKILKTQSGNKKGTIETTSDWVDKDGTGNTVLKEHTHYAFTGNGSQRIIDRTTTLTANTDVNFKDVKDGFLALRVARELEQPSDKPEIFTDANGIETKVAQLNNEGVTGLYRSSAGQVGDNVWATRGNWAMLNGKIKNENISVVIIDNTKNLGYPTYWHARGYGLFAANPLGQNVFSKGKETLNLSLKKGESVTFRYRIIIDSKILSDQEIEKLSIF